MKKTMKRILAIILVVVMTIGAAPLSEFVGFELPKSGGFRKLADSVSDFWGSFSTKAKATDSKCVVWFWVDNELYDYADIAYGEEIPAPITPSKEGYVFLGWSKDGVNVLDDLGTVTGDIDFYAVYRKSATITSCKQGDIIEFGWYPQSEVTDISIISELNFLAGDNKSWTSYRYYSGSGSPSTGASNGDMTAGDYMRYKDVMYGSDKYRGVFFDTYRPYCTGYSTSLHESYSKQYFNGYIRSTVYWFKYEPIEWRVIEPATGMVMAEKILDSQAYNNYILSNETTDEYGNIVYWGDLSQTFYANNYANSSIREWLNNDFYNIAFSTEQHDIIEYTSIDNVKSEPICDKIYLLSSDDVCNVEYGFDSLSYEQDTARQAHGSDYAKCQGLETSVNHNGNFWWRLRTAGKEYSGVWRVDPDGYTTSYYDVNHTDVGIRPALSFNLNAEIFQSDVKDTDRNSQTKEFNENSYIADIWLNKREGEETQESKLIENILTFDSISTQYYDSLKNNTVFQKSLLAWNGLKLVFKTENAIEEMVLSKADIYETLIFDMLKKSLAEKQKDYTNIILDSVEMMGEGSETITKYKGIADNLVDMVDKPTENLLEILKEWKFNPQSDSFSKFYGSLNDIHYGGNKWNNSQFVEGVGAIAETATGVADFYERFVGYCMAMDMSDDMKTLLNEMYNQTDDYYFQEAILRVLASVENAGFAGLFCAYETYEDAMVNFVGYCFEEVAKSSKIYTALKKAYEGSVAFNDIAFGTSGTISAYYLAEATAEFVSANKAAINSLAQKYLVTGKETDASAYVFSVQTYGHVVAIDWDTGANFVKKATDEGLLNKSEERVLKLKNFFTGNNEKTSYEEYLKTKDRVLDCWNEYYSLLNTTWKYNPEYLKSYSPEMFLVFVGEEIIKSEYAPYIINAIITKSGKTQVEYSLNNGYDVNGKKYDLYRYDLIDGIYASEVIDNGAMSASHTKTEMEYDISEAPNPIEFYNEKIFKSRYDKKYTLKTYAEANDEKVYSSESIYYVGNPINKVEIGYCNVVDLLLDDNKSLGIPIKIKDSTSVYYNDVNYEIYRKTKGSDWTKIATVPRTLGLSGDTTIFYDKDINVNSPYTYKVISYFEFDNGITLYSAESEPVTMSVEEIVSDVVEKTVLIVEVITSMKTMSVSTIDESFESDNFNGIKLSWNSFENAEKYEIYRKSSYANTYQLVDTVNSDQLTYYDDTVENGVRYIYVVVPYFEGEDGKCYNLSNYANGEIEYKISDDEIPSEPTTKPEKYVCSKCGQEFTVEELYIAHESVCKSINEFKVEIRTPSTTIINYGDSIWLHAEISGELPADAKIIWTPSNNNFEIVEVSADGKSCKITPKSNGTTTFTVSVVDANENVLSTDTQDMNAKAGLWQKIVAFFKKLFGATKTYPELFRSLF